MTSSISADKRGLHADLRGPKNADQRGQISFKERVYEIVACIPKGHVLTYKEVARRAGRPKAYRAVGNILHRNTDIKNIPCHRVIRSDGKIGGYASGSRKKRILLLKERAIKF